MRISKETYALVALAFSSAVFLVLLVLASAPGFGRSPGASDRGLTPQERLGKQIFFDTNLSEPRGLSCSSCHAPEQDFSGNNAGTFGAALGSRPGISGLRNTPGLSYASFTPPFHFEKDENGKLIPVGGFFRDGRADSLAAQAEKPLFNPREMNNSDPRSLAGKMAAGSYAAFFRQLGGQDIFAHPDRALAVAAQALQAFERTSVFHPFASRYDDYIQGRGTLTAEERRGLALFKNPQKGNCASCHTMNDKSPDGRDSLFTDYTYDSLGLPRNLNITDNGNRAFFDLGLCGPERSSPRPGDTSLCGAFKVPSLRNVAKRKFYFHNGVFTSLHDAVAFYATRDTNPQRWYPEGRKFNDLPPQYRGNVNTDEVPYNRKAGEQPALTDDDIDALAAFLKTLSDR